MEKTELYSKWITMPTKNINQETELPVSYFQKIILANCEKSIEGGAICVSKGTS